jgi:putative FmdB family regulatory protein
MPIYEFKCDVCGKVTERISKVDYDMISCPDCDFGMARRIISKTSFRLNGGGWAKDNYSRKQED